MKALFSEYKILLVIAIIIFIYPLSGFAQVDSIAGDYKREFESFKQSGQQDFDSFRKKNDSIFISYLKDSWKTFDAIKSEMPSAHKPKEQPVFRNVNIKEEEIEPGNKRPPEEPLLEPVEPPVLPNKPRGIPMTTFDFCEVPVEIMKSAEPLPSLKSITPEHFVEFYEQASQSPSMEYNAKYLFAEAGRLGLNDWGLVQILMKAAETTFAYANEQVLFTWYVLLRNGYDVKTGYDNDQVYLLVPSRQDLYNTLCFQIKGKSYFLLKLKHEPAVMNSINAYEEDYPGNEVRFSLIMDRLPSFPCKPMKRVIPYQDSLDIIIDQNILDYLSTFPECDLVVQFSTPLSDLAASSFERALQKKVQGKSDLEVTTYFLKLLQYGFPYMNDLDQFGFEKYMFAEQALLFPYTDCDDRSVLLARLIKKFTHAKVIGLQYPDHVALGVNFEEPLHEGVCIELEGLKYYFCDPTYIGADPGMIPPGYQGLNPEIVRF